MNAIDPIKHYNTEYQRLAEHLPGAALAWLQPLKTTALETLTRQGFPTLRNEDWKYTNIAAILKKNFSITTTPPTINFSVIMRFLHERGLHEKDVHLICIVDGYFVAELSQINDLPANVKVASLAEVLQEDDPIIAEHLEKLNLQNSHAFKQLNTLFLQDGVYIYLPVQTLLKKPIYLLFINSSAQTNMVNIRNCIIAENYAKADITEHYISLDQNNYFTNTITELFLNASTQITHTKLQQESSHAFHIGTLAVKQQAHSEFISHSFSLGGSLVRSDIEVDLIAEHTHCYLNGLYLGTGKQHVDHHTTINHHTSRGNSYENYKGVLNENAHAVFNGKIWVAAGAIKTNARQTNKNLTLSNTAEINTKPQLEIYTDDVQCTHGAAIGQLDENALFYLRSRGINFDQARNLLIYAFIQELLDKISSPLLRQQIQSGLQAYLPQQLLINESLC